MLTVLQDLTPGLLRSLYKFDKSLPEFQVVLSQLYDGTERSAFTDRLRDAELGEFVDFLDDVSQLSKCLQTSVVTSYIGATCRRTK